LFRVSEMLGVVVRNRAALSTCRGAALLEVYDAGARVAHVESLPLACSLIHCSAIRHAASLSMSPLRERRCSTPLRRAAAISERAASDVRASSTVPTGKP